MGLVPVRERQRWGETEIVSERERDGRKEQRDRDRKKQRQNEGCL